MAKKTLVIDSKSPVPPKNIGTWIDFDGSTTNFIKGIDVNAIANNNGDGNGNVNVNTKGIVSGIPTPWARAVVFKQALENTKGVTDGLKSFYDKIIIEWRALIAFIALNGSGIDIRIKKIELGGDGNSFKSRLGKMLFQDVDKWKDPSSPNNSAYIQLVQHKIDQNTYVTVGATSPYSIVFTPSEIRNNNKPIGKFIDNNGQWKDPLKCELTSPELQTIYDTVAYIKKNIPTYATRIKINPTSLDSQLKSYLDDLINYNNNGLSGQNIQKFNILDRAPIFKTSPFDILFNAKSVLFVQNGKFYLNGIDGKKVAIKINEFFAKSQKAVEIVFDTNNGESPQKNTGHFLTVNDGKVVRYFAIPLSEKGILFFQDKLDSLLGNNGGEHTLKGKIVRHDRGARLKVFLDITYYNNPNSTESNTTRVEQEYEISMSTNLRRERVMVWPDFISSNWNKYYLYNGLPHHLTNDEVRVTPLLGNIDNDKVELKRNNNQIDHIEPNPIDESTNHPGVRLVVKASNNSKLKYEIYESELPFIGIEFSTGKNRPENAGYVIAKDIGAVQDGALTLKYINNNALSDGIVGVDFGSNNTCFSYYSINNENQKLIKLKNRRRFFVGSDRSDNTNLVAGGAELFFFNKTEANGHLKSMVLSHKSNKIYNYPGNVKNIVRGGFPVMEKNLPISPDPMPNPNNRYELAINNEKINVIHNMKWSPDPVMNDYKKSFLKALWLQINAELFEIDHRPTTLRWAYPAAMNAVMINNYKNLWKDVIQLSPISGGNLIQLEDRTEGEAVATYANNLVAGAPGGGLTISDNTIGIGYDVGGSTTDILLLIKQGGQTVLAKQSSVLLAAQYISRAIQNSNQFRKVLKEYLINIGVRVHGIKDMDEHNAPYFLNAVFDRLDSTQLDNMYLHFYNNNQRKILAVAAFISGLLTYYTGQLAARVIKEQDADINNVTKGIYGKGGNIFNWVSVPISTADKEFYHKCFKTGLGQNNIDDQIAELQNDSGDLDKLKKQLADLEATYEIVPDEEVMSEIVNIKNQIEQAEGSSENVDIEQLEKEIEDITQKIVKIEGNKHIPSVAEALQKLKSELEQKNAILKSVNQSDNKNQLQFLNRIKNVSISPTTSYKTKPKENKTEVSYGLSLQTSISRAAQGIPEIIGEKGYTYNEQSLSFTDEVKDDHLDCFGGDFKLPIRFEKLEEFVEIYCDFVKDFGLLSSDEVNTIKESVKRLSVDYFDAYVKSLPQNANRQNNQTFKSPMIILEGMCLLDNIIIEEILKK